MEPPPRWQVDTHSSDSWSENRGIASLVAHICIAFYPSCVSPFIKQLKHSSIDNLFSLWEEQNIGRDNCDAEFPVKLFVVTCERGSHAMSRDTLVTTCLSAVSPLHLAILPRRGHCAEHWLMEQ